HPRNYQCDDILWRYAVSRIAIPPSMPLFCAKHTVEISGLIDEKVGRKRVQIRAEIHDGKNKVPIVRWGNGREIGDFYHYGFRIFDPAWFRKIFMQD
ncbi:MAG: hypothetical protein ACRC55_00805, partial [Plesiomonas sp.]